MWVVLQVLNTLLIFAAGILLATRIYPALFGSADATGHDYIQNLEAISRELSEQPMTAEDVEFLKQKTVHALTLITESLVDNQALAADTRSRTRLGLILLAAGSFFQGLLAVFPK
jgi:hypothetical protein